MHSFTKCTHPQTYIFSSSIFLFLFFLWGSELHVRCIVFLWFSVFCFANQIHVRRRNATLALSAKRTHPTYRPFIIPLGKVPPVEMNRDTRSGAQPVTLVDRNSIGMSSPRLPPPTVTSSHYSGSEALFRAPNSKPNRLIKPLNMGYFESP